MEDLTIRHRNRLRHHYTQTSNVLLFGYQNVSDGTKLTYQVIDSFDWSDAAGVRKGFAHPSLRRIAVIRGVEKRTVRRHLAELERARLIAREERPGRPNVLVIEDPSEEETRRYLRTFDARSEDNTVLPTPDETVPPYKKEERKERQNLVNEEEIPVESLREPGRAEHIGDTIKAMATRLTRPARRPPPKAQREYLALEMLATLRDRHSLGHYRRIAEETPSHVIFGALSQIRTLAREGRITKSRGAAFVSLIRASSKPAPSPQM